MAGRVAVAVAGRAGGAGLAEAPGRAQPLARGAREEQRVGLGRGAHAVLQLADLQEPLARGDGIDDGAAEEIGGGAGHREQRRGDEAAGRGFGDRDRLAPRLQQGADPFRPRDQVFHALPPDLPPREGRTS